MRQIFVVYETDAWHSTSHRECAGVFTSKWAAVNAIVKKHRIELDEFFDEDEIKHTSKRVLEAEARRRLRKELEFAYQTQGYEWHFEGECPIVAAYDYDEPCDVVILSVRVNKEGKLTIIGDEKNDRGNEHEIEADDIFAGHMDFITSEIGD